jgi:thiamine-monophosphate kinase
MCADETNKLSEFELISWIEQQTGKSELLSLGIGDDCAIQRQNTDWDLLTSTDLLIEDIHFKRQWTTLYNLGRKAAAVNISDIAAMGGVPVTLYLGIGRPQEISDLDMKEFIAGFIYEGQLHGAELAGGDTCASKGGLMISVTVQGQVAHGEAICRKGASFGDAIYVSGTLGDSALALKKLLAGESVDKYLSGRFHLPTPRVELGRTLAARQIATAMLDLSDGLVSDLGHILKASGIGAEIELDSIPLSQEFRQAMEDDATLIDLALAGGEDYELIFTSPLKDLADQPELLPGISRIGAVCQQQELRLRQADGKLYQCQSGGFDHFD